MRPEVKLALAVLLLWLAAMYLFFYGHAAVIAAPLTLNRAFFAPTVPAAGSHFFAPTVPAVGSTLRGGGGAVGEGGESERQPSSDDAATDAALLPDASTAAGAPVVSCGRASSKESYAALARTLARAAARGSGHVVVGTMSLALRRPVTLHLLSLRLNAPALLSSYVLVCYDRESQALCERLGGDVLCALDPFAVEIGFKSTERMAGMWSKDGHVRKSVYLELIWHKPELVRYALLAGAERVTLVDVDTLWMADPTPGLSGGADLYTMAEHDTRSEGRTLCTRSALGPKGQVANTGFVHLLEGNGAGLEFTRRWLAERRCSGSASLGGGHPDEELDQKALSRVGCDMELEGGLATVLLSSSTFLLNPLHRTVRAAKKYDVCDVQYFHSIICSPQKEECMLRHLARTREWGNGVCGWRGALCAPVGGGEDAVAGETLRAVLCELRPEDSGQADWVEALTAGTGNAAVN